MPTSEELQEAEELTRALKARGIAMNLLLNPPPKGQWYRKDGTALPNLLPADAWHRSLYQGKGWTLLPPVQEAPDHEEVPVTPFLDAVVSSGVRSHVHTYAKAIGSPCEEHGCRARRKKPFVHRRKAAVMIPVAAGKTGVAGH